VLFLSIAIRLGRLLPDASSNLPGHLWQDRQCCRTAMSLHGLASDGVYPASSVTRTAVRSYRNLFTLTCSKEQAVCFLWHFPWGRPRWTLSSIL